MRKKEKFMKLLEINNGKAEFIVDGKNIKPENISRDHFLSMLTKIYRDKNNAFELPKEENLSSINNPVEREIVNSIIKKLQEFTKNVDNLRNEVESMFPRLD